MKKILLIALLAAPSMLFAQEPQDSTLSFSITLPNAALVSSLIDDQGVDVAIANAFNGISDTVGKYPVVVTQAQLVRVMNTLSPLPNNVVSDLLEELRADLMPLLPARPWLMGQLVGIDASSDTIRTRKRARGVAEWWEIMESQNRN